MKNLFFYTLNKNNKLKIKLKMVEVFIWKFNNIFDNQKKKNKVRITLCTVAQ